MSEERARREPDRARVDCAQPGQRTGLAALRVYFLNTTVTYGIFLWLPKILADASG